MGDYSEPELAAERLQRCYELAPPRARQYLDAELAHVLDRIKPNDVVIELGSGYGRILPALARKARLVIGIDTSRSSIDLGHKLLAGVPNCRLFEMNALALRFPDRFFDKVVCIQNGLSAFHVDQRAVIIEAVRVTRKGGTALFSTYASGFWPQRLEWLRRRAAAGLVGPIDWDKTRDGTIVCTDGLTTTTLTAAGFRVLTQDLTADVRITEVDESSLFCEITP